ncbi:FtsX-like permease family protein [Streptomyces sioyaensis]|uniref:ABC transporter permease n=1 Tax=Streptomyces sioyaensis TaxID=67364 RepID=A0A4Q1QGW0_9ACTN|nr:FtsX-like permease family protein [Streptomyces sioyaensis]MBM4791272.1 FtsX-like permease family protein [Streptomyces sioyaensis]RXS58007.1 ABC transporter permease [Streptomyces sioyaensis]
MSGFVFVFLRVRAHRLLLTAALLSVLLTTTVLATLTAFTGAIGDAGLRQALRTRAAPAAALQVKAQLPAAQRQAADRAVARGARRAFDGLPFTVRTLIRSGPYALPRTLRSPRAPKDEPDLTQLAALDRSRLTLTAGHWPTAVRRGPLPVAMPAAAAARLGIAPGRRLTLDNRLSGSASMTVEVTGVYRPTDRADPYWKLDDLGGRGVRTLGFTTYGPLYTDPAAFRGGAARGGGVAQDSVGWLATADFRPLTADRLTALSAAATAAPKALMADPAFAGQAAATTGLPDALGQLQRALLVNRSTILIVALQLILLAGCALLLVARMLSTERAGETALLRARGGSRRRIAGLALAESLLLAAPAALGAPPLTGPLLHLLAGHGPSARIGLPLDTGLTGATWLTGGAVALGCALAVAAPALLRTGPAAPHTRRARALPGATGVAPARTEWKAWGRTGADLGLLVIAGVAFWQLQRQTAGDGAGSGVLTGDTTGQLGIDPVLVAAPALALLAGTVLTLRLLPLAARLAERGAARGRGLAAALAGWQLSRRPQRAAGPVLLLVLATALGMLAIGQGASWDRSQDDQADFRAAAPVRVLASRTPQWGQGGAYADVPGVAAALPAALTGLDLPDGKNSSLLALDTVGASPARTKWSARGSSAGALLLRGDLVGGAAGDPAGAAADRLLRAVAPHDGPPAGMELPPHTDRLRLTATLRSLRTLPPSQRPPMPDTDTEPQDTGPVPATLSALLTDGHGVPYALPLGSLAADGRPHPLTADLAAAAGAPAGRPAAPLRLTGLVAGLDQPPVAHRQQLTVTAAETTAGDGPPRPLAAPAALRWQPKITDTSTSVGQAFGPKAGRAEVPRGGLLSQTYDTGARLDPYGASVTTVRITAAHAARPPLAAVATEAFLRASGSTAGSVVEIPVNGQSLKARIVRAVRALPGPADAPATGGLLVDLGAVNEALSDRGAPPLTPAEWWLRPAPGATGRVVEALRARPDTDPDQVLVRDEIAGQLHDDPLGLGPQTALGAAAVAAVALAAVGFGVGAAASVRERTREFAVLRALGAPRGQPARMIAAEQGVLIALALGVGAALGTALTRAVVPLVVLTEQAGRPRPPVLVELPAGPVVALLAAVAAVPLLVVAALGLRPGDPVRALRGQGARP